MSLCDMSGCLSVAEYVAVYGCFNGHVYTRSWCRPCTTALLDKVGTGRWYCAEKHHIMDMIYRPIHYHEYTISGRIQVMDYNGKIVA